MSRRNSLPFPLKPSHPCFFCSNHILRSICFSAIPASFVTSPTDQSDLAAHACLCTALYIACTSVLTLHDSRMTVSLPVRASTPPRQLAAAPLAPRPTAARRRHTPWPPLLLRAGRRPAPAPPAATRRRCTKGSEKVQKEALPNGRVRA